MRPRSAHLAVWGLPTIKEGHEDHMLDANQQDSLSGPSSAPSEADSPDDYLWSISQLARPAFCSPDSKAFGKQWQDAIGPLRHPSGLSNGHFNVAVETEGCLCNGREYLNKGCIRKPGSTPPPLPLANTCLRNSGLPLHPGRPAIADTLAFPPKELKSPRSRQLPRGGPSGTGCPPALQRDRAIARVDDDSASRWMADCRTAWREARVQACVLPAIAEV